MGLQVVENGDQRVHELWEVELNVLEDKTEDAEDENEDRNVLNQLKRVVESLEQQLEECHCGYRRCCRCEDVVEEKNKQTNTSAIASGPPDIQLVILVAFGEAHSHPSSALPPRRTHNAVTQSLANCVTSSVVGSQLP